MSFWRLGGAIARLGLRKDQTPDVRVLLLTRPESVDEIRPFLESRGTVTVVYDNDYRNSRGLAHCEVDVAVSFSFGPILTVEDLNRVAAPVLNVHPTYLPWGRGIYPILWSAYEGTPQGASIHRVDSGIDSGPVYARTPVDLATDLTLEQARRKLVDQALVLLRRELDSIVSGRLVPTPQSELGPRQPYRSRAMGIQLLDRFPQRWRTTLREVRRQGLADGVGIART